MQIQRLQSLLLLLAVAVMCILCLTPYAQNIAADGTPTPVFMKDTPVLLVVNICIAVLLLLNIFMYKNLRKQMRVTLLSILLLAGSCVASGFVITIGMPGARLIWTGGVLLLIVALILTISAYRCMRRDHRKLTSYDRLR